MSRRRGTFHDPTVRLATREDERLKLALDALNPREAAVIAMRFGLTDGQPKTLDEIGKVYGVTRVRIRQILEAALVKLRGEPSEALAVRADGNHGELIDFIDVAGTQIRLSEFERRALTVSCGYCALGFTNGAIGHWGIRDWCGRPRQYCSNKCRQAAYRLRRVQARRQQKG
jgi:hypothetical protein